MGSWVMYRFVRWIIFQKGMGRRRTSERHLNRGGIRTCTFSVSLLSNIDPFTYGF